MSERLRSTVRNLGLLVLVSCGHQKLAPYSIDSVTLAFAQSTQRLHICIMEAGLMGSRDYERARTPPAAHDAAFEIHDAAPGIAVLAVHDLHGHLG